MLRDAVPANTTYVAGSTTLNGAAVADVAGLSPLVNGMPINSPANTTPGSMPADASSSQANVATITFDVVVNPNVANGTVISNQGFVTAVASGIVDQPSDDPDTPTPNDPTRDIVGNLPSLYAEKSVALFGDLGSPGIVDPGDVLRYTITVKNSAAIPATGVVLTRLGSGEYDLRREFHAAQRIAGRPAGRRRLAARLGHQHQLLQPDAAAAGSGQARSRPGHGSPPVRPARQRRHAGGHADQQPGRGDSVELPNLLTDGDGNPATGPEPTVVVVGAGQQLSITKQVTVVGGGAAVPGAQLEYVVSVANIAAVPAINVVITDDLDASQPGQLAYVNGSATMNGSTAGVTLRRFDDHRQLRRGQRTAGAGRGRGAQVPGHSQLRTLRTARWSRTPAWSTWNNPTQTASASVSIVVGSIPARSPLVAERVSLARRQLRRCPGFRRAARWLVGRWSCTAITSCRNRY